MTSPAAMSLQLVPAQFGARGHRLQRPQGAPNSQNDKRCNSACPPRTPSPNQVSSQHMQSCASQQLHHLATFCSCILFFQDHAFAGIGAGTVAVLCMNPLDLLKVKFQVSTRGPEGGIGRGIWRALCDIRASEGWRGLYRGLGPNVAGNASSWGLYFLLCVLLLFPYPPCWT
jgi:hypothetical protein